MGPDEGARWGTYALRVLYALALGVILLSAVSTWRGEVGGGSAFVILGAMLAFGGGLLITMIMTLIALTGALFGVDRLLPIAQFLASATILCAKVMGVLLVGALMLVGIEELVLRRAFRASEGIASAIEAFVDVHGAPPQELGELAPTYLLTLPGTTLSAHPTFGYDPDGRNGDWELLIDGPTGSYRRGAASEALEHVSPMHR